MRWLMDLIAQLRALIVELFTKFITNDHLVSFLATFAMIIILVLFAFIIIKLVRLVVLRSRALERKFGKEETKEQQTVRRLVVNIIQFFFYFWIAIMILRELGLDVIPVIAGAGVLAFAIGFGAQELIKDVIAGMFLILEKTFKIGDYIEIGTHSGTIVDVGLRRIKIENWRGEVITINNGDIRTIKNYSLNPGMAVVEFRADYDFNFKVLESADFKAFMADFAANNPNVLAMPEKVLLIDLNDGLKFVVHIKTKIRKYKGVERDFRKALMIYFQKKKIEVVVPVVIKADKEWKIRPRGRILFSVVFYVGAEFINKFTEDVTNFFFWISAGDKPSVKFGFAYFNHTITFWIINRINGNINAAMLV